MTKGYVSRLENGRARPSEEMIAKLSALLQCDGRELLLLAGYLPDDLRRTYLALAEESFEVAEPAVEEYALPASGAPEAGMSLHRTDCFTWLQRREARSIQAVVTDPPYGLKEFSAPEKEKLRKGRGGVWRIPPSLGGYTRSPLPRFTVLTAKDKKDLVEYFTDWGRSLARVLVPGGHLFIATNPLVSHLLYLALETAGFEKRGEIIRLVQTLRGGDRPKNAHQEFADVTVMPRSAWEPWGVFRKPCEGRVEDNLRKWRTGGLRRLSADQPFGDVVRSSPTRPQERAIAPHPALKPQALMRHLVRAALPFGEGIVLDPFMGAGATIAAAQFWGYESIGIELDEEYYQMARRAIPRLATLRTEMAAPTASAVPRALRAAVSRKPTLAQRRLSFG